MSNREPRSIGPSTNHGLSRRALLGGTGLALALALGGPRPLAAQEKLNKQDAKYQERPKNQQRCEICVNFEPPQSCRFVEGEISPKGWCQFFAARENAD
jgi:hypothetical protein